MKSSWFSLHTHTQFSVLDGMVPVPELVAKVAAMGQPALAITDHGSMAGTTQLYLAAKKHGILPFPGIETYLIDPNIASLDQADNSAGRFHLGIVALNYRGYQALVRLSSLAHTRPRFNRFPRLMLSDLQSFAHESNGDVVVTTGCFFGLVQQALDAGEEIRATRIVKLLAKWFPHLVVELQNHNITHDSFKADIDIVKQLVDIADELGLPVMATQDSHYMDQRQKAAHALMKRMVYSGSSDDEFPGDYFHLASSEWVQSHYPKDIWAKVEETSAWLLSLHELKIPALDKFKAHIPQVTKDPNKTLRQLAVTGLKRMTGEGWSITKVKRYWDRLYEELAVIKDVGYADYFLLVREVVDFCKRSKICVETRGSANGSLVCFVLGITTVDPIKWKTVFERFVSRDRIKPPDIDLDIEDSRRDEVIQWLQKRFKTAKIGTWSKLGSSPGDEERGSVLVTYIGYLRRTSEQMAQEYLASRRSKVTKAEIQDYGRRIFGKRFAHIKNIDDVRELDPKDYKGLRELAKMESVYKSYGVHAGGILLAGDDVQIEGNIPTMLVASSDTTVTQFDMDDVTSWGLTKLDLLGQATLTVMRMCQELIGRDDPSDFTWIPDNDRAACKLLRSGQTDTGIFHQEGFTKAKGGKEMGVASTKDCLMLQALYMPGAMDSGQKDVYLRGRRGGYKPKYLHKVFEEVLAETHGAVIFQEQPLIILRKLGMSMANINTLFSVLKDSGRGAIERNAKRMQELRKEFNYLCAGKHNIKNTEEAWHLVTGFVAYGFNRAHAAGYGIRMYRCAYLKAHYPLEFMAALLAVWSTKGTKTKKGESKELVYAREARRMGILLLRPHINLSGTTWTLDRRRNAIRRGLLSIKGLGPAAAAEISANAPYQSIEDLVDRCSGRAVSGGKSYLKEGVYSGKLLALKEAGALEGLD